MSAPTSEEEEISFEESVQKLKDLLLPDPWTCSRCGTKIRGTDADIREHVLDEARAETIEQIKRENELKQQAIEPNHELKDLLESRL